MAIPSASVIKSANTAARRMADCDTPFIFNEWYVAAFADEVDRTLLKRTLLGRRIVMFRTQAGQPVALDDRCPHRSYPLSSGAIDGDTLVCGYHGFRYDQKGTCVQVPALAKCPQGIGVRTYPVCQRGPVVWIWLGDPEGADPEKIVDLPWMTASNWAHAKIYFHLGASYVYINENLVDTTHLGFMHANTIGTPDYVTAPTQTEVGEGRFALIRTVSPTRLPPVWGKTTGLDCCPTAARVVRGEFMSPALFEFTTHLYDGALAERKRVEYRIKVAHMNTPESAYTTHYFISLARDFALQDEAATEFMATGFFAAFKEDVSGLALVQEQIKHFGQEAYEISVSSDELGVLMRRYLKQRSDQEQGTNHPSAVTRANGPAS
jgi:phenylpropionate dioxygenase-like ring-hydroxylating dioxygenase large terminal subunit